VAGQFLAVGTSSGAVGQYIKPSAVSTAAWLQNAENGEGLRTTELYRVNEVGCSLCGCGLFLLLAFMVFSGISCIALVLWFSSLLLMYSGKSMR
jgi:hypothetical protein